MLEQVLVFLVRVGQFSAGWVSVREGDTFSILTTTELPPELTQEDLSEMQNSLYHCQNLAQMGNLKSGVEIIDCDRLEHRPEISLKRLITIPITVDGVQIFAFMNLAYEETRLFNENTLRIYSEVGEMLSSLIQKWMHHARALSSFHELSSFYESYKILSFLLDLSRKLFQIRSVERLLEVVSEALKDYFQLDQPVPVRFNRKPGAKEHYLVFDLPPTVRSEQTMMISLVSELTDQAVKLIQLLEKEKNFAERDSLTGLPNRLALEQRASLLLGAQPKLIIMFNIHRLTYINEQYV